MRLYKIGISFLLVFALVFAAAFAEDTTSLIIGSRTTQSFTDEPVAEEDLRTILEAGLAAVSAINQQPWYFVAVTNKEVMEEINGSAGSFGSMPAGGAHSGGMPWGDSSGGNMPGGNMPWGDSSGGNMPGGNTPWGNAPSGDVPNDSAPASNTSWGETPTGDAPAGYTPAGGSEKAALGDSPAAIIIYMDESTSSPNPSFDCGLACENMVIAAKALGDGAKVISSPTRPLNGSEHDALCEKLGVDKSYTAVAVLLIGRESETADGVTSASVRSALEDKVSLVD